VQVYVCVCVRVCACVGVSVCVRARVGVCMCGGVARRASFSRCIAVKAQHLLPLL
jgi:hypothetical protein